MSKFTQGPWKIWTTHENEICIAMERKSETQYSGIAWVQRAGRTELGEPEANARLIAAAPELYAACQLTMDYFKNPADLLSTDRIKQTALLISQVHAAIVRAGGK